MSTIGQGAMKSYIDRLVQAGYSIENWNEEDPWSCRAVIYLPNITFLTGISDVTERGLIIDKQPGDRYWTIEIYDDWRE